MDISKHIKKNIHDCDYELKNHELYFKKSFTSNVYKKLKVLILKSSNQKNKFIHD